MADICYLSGRKSCSVRGGFIATNRKDLHDAIRPWLPVYEGFFTYGGMSSKEIEAMAVGIREMTELEVAGSLGRRRSSISSTPARSEGRPGGHPRRRPGLPRRRHALHPPRAAVRISRRRAGRRRLSSPPASAAWSAARSRWIATRTATTSPPTWNCCAWPCRAASTPCRTIMYAADRLNWLYEHRDLVGGLAFYRGAAGAALLRRQDGPQARLGRAPGRRVREGFRPGVLSAGYFPLILIGG